MNHHILISDRDTFIAVSGAPKKEFANKAVGEVVESAMANRKTKVEANPGEYNLVSEHHDDYKGYVIAPIIANGDPIGTVVIFNKEQTLNGTLEQKMAETAASFLARQME